MSSADLRRLYKMANKLGESYNAKNFIIDTLAFLDDFKVFAICLLGKEPKGDIKVDN